MANQIIAHGGQKDTAESTLDYVWRGRGLFETYRDELQYLGGGKWLIPSGSKAGKVYEVRVGTLPDRDRCECQGFRFHNHCSHVVCAKLAAKKSAVCDGCGERHYWPELRVVEEDDGLCPGSPAMSSVRGASARDSGHNFRQRLPKVREAMSAKARGPPAGPTSSGS